MRIITKEIETVWTTITTTDERQLTAEIFKIIFKDDVVSDKQVTVVLNTQEISEDTLFLSAVDTKLRILDNSALTLEEWDLILSQEWTHTTTENVHTPLDKDPNDL